MPRSTRTLLCALTLAALSIGPTAHAKGGGNDAPADPALNAEILLRLRSTGDLPALLNTYGLSLQSQFGARPIYRTRVTGSTDADSLVERLTLDPAVIQVERNHVHRSPEARSSTAWAIGNATQYAAQWAPGALRLDRAHKLSTGEGVRVAVLDTGIDAGHPVFAGRLLAGHDFVDGDRDPAEVGAAASHPSFGHGTHVAGLVALVAPAAKIMPLRVLDADGAGNAWVIGEAMLHAMDPDGNPATDDGAHVINLSLGSTSRTEILDTLARLGSCAIPEVITKPADDYSDPGYNPDKQRCSTQRGALVIAAAGNDASADLRQYPAAEGAYGLLPVTASNGSNTLADFANSGGWIDAAAPGEGLTSALPGGLYGTWSGTSMAAAVASGTAALVAAHEPKLSPKDLARRLSRVAGTLCGTRIPRIDAAAAVENVPAAASSCR
jgi:subtilisin family serine protease